MINNVKKTNNFFSPMAMFLIGYSLVMELVKIYMPEESKIISRPENHAAVCATLDG